MCLFELVEVTVYGALSSFYFLQGIKILFLSVQKWIFFVCLYVMFELKGSIFIRNILCEEREDD